MEHTAIILLFVIKVVRKRRVVLLDGPCAVNTMHTSTWERPLCTITSLFHTILPHTVCSFVDFSVVPPFFHEPQAKSAVTGTDEAALSFRKEGAYEKGYTCALARSSGIYADADIDQ